MKESSRKKLIREAQKLFVKKGFKGASVREIAAMAQANISAISYYFSGKKGLYAACLEEFGQESLAFGQKVLVAPTDSEDFLQKLSIFSLKMFDMYARRPDLVKLVIKEIENRDALFDKGPEGTFIKLFLAVVDFFKSAQDQGLVKQDLDAETIASLFMASFLQGICQDTNRKALFGHSIKDDEDYRKKYSRHIVEIFIKGAGTI